MAGQRVEISYEAYVHGLEKIDELVRKNQEVNGQIREYEKRLKTKEQAEERSESVNLKLRRGIIAFRRELFAASIAIGAVTGAVKLLSLGSDALQERLEAIGDTIKRTLGPLGDWLARKMGNQGRLSTASQVRLLTMEAEVAQLSGNTRLSLLKKLEAEEKRLIKETGSLWETTYKGIFEERKSLILEAQRLEELGLKRSFEIIREMKRNLIGAVREGISDPLFKLLQGERQTAGDVLRGFQAGFNRAISGAISDALISTIFGGEKNFFQNFKDALLGRNPMVKKQEETNRKLDEIQGVTRRVMMCVCETAGNTAAIAGAAAGTARMPAVTYELPKVTGLQRAQGIVGGVGQIAGIFAGMGGGGGAGISGMPIPRFQAGGEVPAVLHAGEFVVNRRAAGENKAALRAMNAGGTSVGNPSTGGNNFYVSIRATDAKSVDDMLSTPSARARFGMQVIRLIMENSDVRRVIRDFAR